MTSHFTRASTPFLTRQLKFYLILLWEIQKQKEREMKSQTSHPWKKRVRFLYWLTSSLKTKEHLRLWVNGTFLHFNVCSEIADLFFFFFLEPLLLVFNVLTTIVPTPTSVGECEDWSHKYTVIVKRLKNTMKMCLNFRSLFFFKK